MNSNSTSRPSTEINNSRQRNLKELLQAWDEVVAGTALPQPPAYTGPDVALSRLVEHTADVAPGTAFVARVREASDGHPYIPQAIEKGASVIIGQRAPEDLSAPLPERVPYLQVPDTAVALAWLSAAWEAFPSRELVVVGVTGTDGKTTTCNILYELMHAGGLRAGLLSTVRAVIGEVEEPLGLHVSTPEAPVVQRLLRRMVDAGLTHCILEATSHGLAQHRVGAVDFDVAVVTNITHEHLDYHGSYEAYFEAKARLFRYLTALSRIEAPQEPENPFKRQIVKTAVLNIDDDSYPKLLTVPAPRHMTYGIVRPADIAAEDIRESETGSTFMLHLPTGDRSVTLPLPGLFNVYNALAAATSASALGLSPDVIRDGLQALSTVPGRMERIEEGQPFQVIVDFAHTPNGLEQLLNTARAMAGPSSRIITVAGSAGKRDVAKRRMLAEIAARDADYVVLTAEDPRTEPVQEILEMMAESCIKAGAVEGETFWRIPDRGRAIYHALSLAQPKDIVLICGKGHEQSMCFGTTEYPWDERQATRAALQALREGKPAPDLGLPTYGEAEG